MKIVIKDKLGNKFASFEVFNHHKYEETYIDLEKLEDCEVVGITEENKYDGFKGGEVIDLVIDTRINLGEESSLNPFNLDNWNSAEPRTTG